MYFKSLELFGFKSFATKTKLEFEPGVTAIVGPNGCGKSNILDAIRWVLGEQSIKSLRGLKMEDVIFNGTELAEAINMAEVSLTLSNHSKLLPVDYEEITVTRRLFRSGESEYLLNKTPVRLKDINELLMGTGIGTESYSIIGQGKIDAIISSDQEARREIFEEASGITKFKSKKKEALRKLEQTDENLIRINDIIQEVKRQINSITRSVQKAEKYKERFDELKTLELKLGKYDFNIYSRELEIVSRNIATLKSDEENVQKELEVSQAEASSYKEKLGAVDDKHYSLRESISRISATIENISNKIEFDKVRIDESNLRIANLDKEILILQERLKHVSGIIEDLRADLVSVEQNEQAKSSELNERTIRIDQIEREIKETLQKIEESKNTIVNQSANLAKAKNEIIKITSDLSNRSQRERRLVMEKETVSVELSGVNDKLNQCEDGIRNTMALFEESNSRKINLESTINRVTEELAGIDSKINDLKNTLFANEAKLGFFEDLVKKHEGFKEGARAILLANENNQLGIEGIFGALCDLVIPKRGFEIALEVALGENADAIVVNNRQTALRLIEYQRSNNLGKASFITIDESFGGTCHEVPNNAVGRLSEFIDCDERFKGLVNNILGNIFIVDDIKSAAESADFSKNDFKIMSRDGEIASRYLLTGGRIVLEEETSLIGREIKIRDLRESITNFRNEITVFEGDRIKKVEESDFVKKELEGLQIEVKKLELELIDKNNQKDTITKEVKRLNDEIALLDLELDEIKDIILDLNSQKESIEKNIVVMENEVVTSENFIKNSDAIIGGDQKEREDLIIRIAELKTEIGLVQKEKDNLYLNIRNYESSFEVENKLIQNKQSELEASRIKITELNNEIGNLADTIEGINKEREAVSIELAEVDKARESLIATLKIAEDRIYQVQKKSNTIRESLYEAELKNKDVFFKFDTLKNTISQSYKVEIDKLEVEMPQEDVNWDEFRTVASELRSKLESMGQVNMVAIEEHKELEERFAFLSKQQEDLTNAKDQLMKAIQKINKTTRELFVETFQKIQIEFKNYFRLLFNGGQAELMLLDDRDVLESGIEIIVRPPGKKLQSISLLSGGEKALTAVALLFSILKIKPTPFCILDEIDAPLDESNVDRFSRGLQEFLKSSQFIIITHNKKTIALSDVMYGITMEKSGISKIVSVKFSDRSHKEEKTGVALKGEENRPITGSEVTQEPFKSDTSTEEAPKETPVNNNPEELVNKE